MRHHVEKPRVRTRSERIVLQLEETLIHRHPPAFTNGLPAAAMFGLRCQNFHRRFVFTVSISPAKAITDSVGSFVKAHISRSLRSAVSLYSINATIISPRQSPAARPAPANTPRLGNEGPSGRFGSSITRNCSPC